MATADAAGGPYASFVSLPRGGAGATLGAASVAGAVTAIAGAAGSVGGARAAAAEAEAAFDLARAVLADYDRWAEVRAREEAARQERKLVMQVPDTGAGAAGAGRRSSQVMLHFKLPDGRTVNQGFEAGAGCFDVYTKVYELLKDKESAFFITVSGPVGGAVTLSKKKLSDDSFADDLTKFGLQAGKAYDVAISQGRR
mmetsp:Transcript_69060/g.135574  ORF Transcript_69060/g.135574 Transcript_69060/m.135574 type:complete len:198 (+) Transcript_69060:105-698(+)